MFNRVSNFLYEKVIEPRVNYEIAQKYLAEQIETAMQLAYSEFSHVQGIVEPNPNVIKDILTLKTAVSEALMKNSTVASCVNMITDSVSSVPFVVHKRSPQGILERIPGALEKRLNNPNSYQDRVLFMTVLTQHIVLNGNGLIHMNTAFATEEVRNMTGPVRSLEILNPDDFDVESDGKQWTQLTVKEDIAKNFPKKYLKRKFLPSEVIHIIDTPDPERPWWGMGRIRSMYKSIDIGSKIQDWWISALNNGCRKDALLKFKKNLGDAQFRRIRSLVSREAEEFKKKGGFMIIGGEHEVEFLNQNPKELDFKDTGQNIDRKIMSVFRVPAPLLGEAEHSTYNNMVEARKALWLDNVLLLCNKIACTLNKKLLPLYHTNGDVQITYDFSKVDALMRQYMDLIATAKVMVDIGMSRDEINEVLDMGWKQTPSSGKSYISVNLISDDERQIKVDLQKQELLNMKTDTGKSDNNPNNTIKVKDENRA